MNKQAVIDHFGGVGRVADAVQISHASVCGWGDVIPEAMAARIDRLTSGTLKYDHELYMRLKAERKQAA